jgi:hypothetical protein
MRRKLFTLAVAVSAVLYIAACLLWVRSYWRADRVDLLTRGSAHRQTPLLMGAVISARGGLGVSVSHGTRYYPDDASWRLALSRPTARRLQHESSEDLAYPRWTGDGKSSDWQGLGFQGMRRVTTAPDQACSIPLRRR